MLLQSIYVLYSNITYTYPVSCLVEIKLFQQFGEYTFFSVCALVEPLVAYLY